MEKFAKHIFFISLVLFCTSVFGQNNSSDELDLSNLSEKELLEDIEILEYLETVNRKTVKKFFRGILKGNYKTYRKFIYERKLEYYLALAELYEKNEDYAMADIVYSGLISFTNKEYPHIFHIISAQDYYYRTNQKEKALKAAKITYDFLNNNKSDNEEFSTFARILASWYAEFGDYTSALEVAHSILARRGISEEIKNEAIHSINMTSMSEVTDGIMQERLGNETLALEMWSRVIERELVDEEVKNYARNAVYSFFRKKDDPLSALKYLKDMYSNTNDEKRTIESNRNRIEVIMEILYCYYYLADIEMMDLWLEELKGVDSPIAPIEYAFFMSKLQEKKKNREESRRYAWLATDLAKNYYGKDSWQYLDRLVSSFGREWNLRMFDSDFDRTIMSKYSEEMIDIVSNKNFKDFEEANYFRFIPSIVMYLTWLEEYDNALLLLDTYSNFLDYHHYLSESSKSDVLQKKANILSEQGKFKESNQLLYQILQTEKNFVQVRIIAYKSIAENYMEMNDFSKAREVFIDAENELTNSTNDFNKLELKKSILSGLGSLYIKSNDLENAAKNTMEQLNIEKELIVGNFAYLTEKEREFFETRIRDYPNFLFTWTTAYSREMFEKHNEGKLDDATIENYNLFHNKVDAFFYDAILFNKGLQLNTSIEINKILQESGDNNVLAQFERLRSIRMRIDKQYQIPISERVLDIELLQNEAEQIERFLVRESKAYGDFTRNLTLAWQDVQAELGDTDVAIEFTSFDISLSYDSNSRDLYVAFVLRKDWDAPLMIQLFEEQELLKLTTRKPDIVYNNRNGLQISELIWKWLLPYINEGDNIYFSPDGILYQLAIESLPIDETRIMSQRNNLFRLSTTKQLCYERLPSDFNNAVLYGGLVYDVEERYMIAQSNAFNNKELYASRGFVSDTTLRSGWRFLPATKTEVENISRLINVPTRVYTGIEGNEESFKALSGQKTSLIHIATHGFFFPNERAERHSYFSNFSNDIPIIDNSLFRSGLLMSGGNKAWRGEQIPNHIEDGILTAREISNLDLRGTSLLVLSACETGLGEITSDGVFGLQRAFKKAGVQTIVMSLWKVDDNATEVMMTEFYTNLSKGIDKRTAFLNAQNKTKEKYPSPHYWAAFIMLD